MNEIVILKENWIKYADAVRDFNPIHRDEQVAKQYGLEGVIAPGMFIASYLQHKGKLSSAGFKFKGSVYDGDKLIPKKDDNGNYKFINLNKDIVCEARNVLFDEFCKDENQECLHEAGGSYFTKITRDNVSKFNGALGLNGNRVPGMFIASLSAPALLNYGKENNIIGFHTSQTFQMHKPCDFGLVEIEICEKIARGNNRKYNLYWMQNKQMIATGESGIYILN